MPKSPPIPPVDLTQLPARVPLPMVLAVCGYGSATLRRRRKQKRMPEPIDRGGDGGIYDRDAVLKALGIEPASGRDEVDPWDFEPGAINEHLARRKRR